ncbi:hypothetical protein BCR43DRAFT_509077 [Syncephalastrum racemosum]|uniref:Uncharacterized protein n=1 Tax=Syncephalastrum racemosum TaxID=13706 RepID=A0A1X2GZA8_SYNRA|nr:hypothetical protein BCR43DRAFT_509077 [Syncephalastrum racemosum]
MTVSTSDIQELQDTTFAMVETSSVIVAINQYAGQFKSAVASSRPQSPQGLFPDARPSGHYQENGLPLEDAHKVEQDEQGLDGKSSSSLEEHNHPLDKTTEFYHQHRKPNEQMRQTIVSMTASSITPAVIQEQIHEDDS